MKYSNTTNYKVYVYKNKSNDKFYVGQTCRSMRERSGKEGKLYLQCTAFGNAIKKYGWGNFEARIVKDNLSREEANNLEKELIKMLKTQDSRFGYNISEGGSSNEYQAFDISGKKFNRWTAISLANTPQGHTGRYWLCRCDCGTQKIIRQCNLLSGATKSCGCYSKEKSSELIPNKYESDEFDNVTVFMNSDKRFVVDKATYENKISNLYFYYDDANHRIVERHNVNLYYILFPFLNKRRSYLYVKHLNNDVFDFRNNNLKLEFPNGFQEEQFMMYLSENIKGIHINKKYKKWIVKKGIVDNKQHSFSCYQEAKDFIAKKAEVTYGN